MHLAEIRRCLPVGPGYGPLKRYLHPGNVTIVTVVNLRGNTADRCVGKAYDAKQQTGLVVKIEIYRKLPRISALEHTDLAIIHGGRGDSPLRKGLLELRRKREHRIELDAFQISSGQRQ